MNNETLEAMMKMIDNILLKRLSSSTVSALALSYLLFKVKVTFSKLLLSKQNGEYGDSHSTEIGHTKGLKVYVDQHSNRVTAGSISTESK